MHAVNILKLLYKIGAVKLWMLGLLNNTTLNCALLSFYYQNKITKPFVG